MQTDILSDYFQEMSWRKVCEELIMAEEFLIYSTIHDILILTV
jgi:hypothetical protein